MYRFGYIHSPADYRDYLYRAIFEAEVLPSSYSRREETGPVRDQGEFGTCVSFASAGVKDNQERRESGADVQTSPLYIYAKCKVLDGIPDQEGTYPRVAMKVLTDNGVCPERVLPYSQMSWPKLPVVPLTADGLAASYKIGAYARISTVDEVKQAIVKDGPVLAGLLVCDSFINTGSNGFVPFPGENGRDSIRGGHAICVVGYDDTMTNGKHTGYFEIRNSWGESWGDAGYGYIPYDFFNFKAMDLGGMPYWQESWSSVDIITPPTTCKEGYLWLNKNYALLDGVEVPLDCPPVVDYAKNRTLVPLRFMAEHMGYKVEWDQTLKQVHFYK